MPNDYTTNRFFLFDELDDTSAAEYNPADDLTWDPSIHGQLVTQRIARDPLGAITNRVIEVPDLCMGPVLEALSKGKKIEDIISVLEGHGANLLATGKVDWPSIHASVDATVALDRTLVR